MHNQESAWGNGRLTIPLSWARPDAIIYTQVLAAAEVGIFIDYTEKAKIYIGILPLLGSYTNGVLWAVDYSLASLK